MAIEGVDYSWGRPDVAELRRAGKRFAVRYVSFNRTGKNLTRGEADALHAAGLATVTNWENSAHDQLGGFDQGVIHAREADRLHRAAGGPPDAPIYFSTDFDASTAQLATCFAYLRGAAEIIGWPRVGVYGGRRTIDYIAARDVRWLWQTYAWSGFNPLSGRFDPEHPRWHPAATIHQYNNGVRLAGADTDLNRAMEDDYGQWGLEEGVSKADVRTGIGEVLDEAARRSTPTGRAIGNDIASLLAKAIGPVRAEVSELRGQVAGLTALVQQLLTSPPVELTPEQLVQLIAAVQAAAREPGERIAAALAAAGEELTGADGQD